MASIIRRRRLKGEDSLKMTSYHDSTMHSSNSCSSQKSTRENVTNFQNAMKLLLSETDREQMTDILGYYHTSRNVYHLVTSLETVLDTPVKRKLLPILRQVLPKADRKEFDRHTTQGNLYAQPNNGTDDSGIGSNTTQTSGTRTSKKITQSSARDNSQSSSNKSSSFGSAVRRKVKAALRQRTRSLERLHDPVPRRRHSFTATLDVPETRQHYSEPKTSLTVPRTRGKISSHWPRDTYDDVKVIFMNRRSKSETMGFSIRGGAEHNLGLYVSHVEMGSPADECGLLLGDQILRVNNTPLVNDVTHEQAVKILAATIGKVVLYVRSIGQVPDAVVTSHNFAWTDVNGRPTSPPPDAVYGAALGSRFTRSDLRLLLTDERRVNLTVQPGQRLGLMIRGGAEYGLGIYITGVDPGSASEQAGLKAGDQILEVNNVSFKSITHAEAVNVIRSNRMLMLMIRHVGRIPQCHISREETKWMSDEQISYHSLRMSRSGTLHRRPGSALGVFQRGLAGSGQVTLRNAQSTTSLSMSSLERSLSRIMDEVEESCLLSDAELHTIRYYISEYVQGHVPVDALVLSLGQLLDTQEKFSVMSSVRRSLFTRDVDRFDLLVLRREVDALRSRHSENQYELSNAGEETRHRRDMTRRGEKVRPEPRSRSVPPPRSQTYDTGRISNQPGPVNLNDSAETHIEGPSASSTPNNSAEQQESSSHSVPRIISSYAPRPTSRHMKNFSPIFKDTSAVLPTPMKLVPPTKPKRSSMAQANDEDILNETAERPAWQQKEDGRNCSFRDSESNPVYSAVSRGHNPPSKTTVLSKFGHQKHQEVAESHCQGLTNSKPSKYEPVYTSVSRKPAAPVSRLYPHKSDFVGKTFSKVPTTHMRDQHMQRAPSPFSAAVEKQVSTSEPSTSAATGNGVYGSCTKSKTQTKIVSDPETSTISVHRINNNVHIIESADESDLPEDSLPPPPMSFLNTQIESPKNRRYPIHADVHRSAAIRETPGYMDLPSDSQCPKKSVKISPEATSMTVSHNATYNNNNTSMTGSIFDHQFDNSIESDDYEDFEYEDVIDPREYLKGVEKQKVIIFKVASTLGLSVEGGANTRQPLPRISSVQPGGCAHMCGRLLPGQIIHEVNGIEMAGLEHQEVARTVAVAFKGKERDSIELLVSGPHENGTT